MGDVDRPRREELSSIMLSPKALLSVLTDRDERIIRRAARAEHAYARHVATCDDARRKQAMMERRVLVNAELRGDPVPLPPADLSTSIDVAVQRELQNMEPAVRTRLTMQRQNRRLGSNCGPVQLVMSRGASATRKLRAILQSCRLVSELSVREVAAALGISERTLERHSAGETMSAERREWYDRLEVIEVEGEYYRILVRRVAPTKKKWGWNLSRDERRRRFSASA